RPWTRRGRRSPAPTSDAGRAHDFLRPRELLPPAPRAEGSSVECELSSSAPMIVVAEPLTRPVAEPPYPTRRKVGELLTVVAVLAAVDLLYPLNRPRFWIPTALISVAAGAYAISGLRRFPGAARRWGFVYQRNREYG